jgi:hypothetical protein
MAAGQIRVLSEIEKTRPPNNCPRQACRVT